MRILKYAALAAVIGLAACAGQPGSVSTGDTSKWPDPMVLADGMSVVETLYEVDCGAQPTAAWCSASAQAKESVCAGAASIALDAYTTAYNSKTVTAATVAAVVPSLTSCIAKIKNGG